MNSKFYLLLLVFFSFKSIAQQSHQESKVESIHVFVALCDNKYQGIVPVPAKIGNGQDPATNLYWGCGFGIKTYFKNSKEWKLVQVRKVDSLLLERLVFKHQHHNVYLIADAYNGKYIQRCTEDFLKSSAGKMHDTLHIQHQVVPTHGGAGLVAYIGHDGLMDFDIHTSYINSDKKTRDIIILACYSKSYFSPHLKAANVRPLVWTNGLMCPEAYTIHDAIRGYLLRETPEEIRSRAAAAYAKYQKCSLKAARHLLGTGW